MPPQPKRLQYQRYLHFVTVQLSLADETIGDRVLMDGAEAGTKGVVPSLTVTHPPAKRRGKGGATPLGSADRRRLGHPPRSTWELDLTRLKTRL